MQGECRSVLIVSKEGRAVDFIKAAIPQSRFSPVLCVSSAAEARRNLLRTPIDIMIINMPLSDEFGTKLAVSSSGECAVVAIVSPEQIEMVSFKLEQYGVVTLSKVLNRSVLYQTMMVMFASATKMRRLRDDTEKLESKLREVRLVTKAKSLLISERDMTEEQAHRFIEKAAMDSGIKKSEAARRVIAKLSDEDD